MNASKSPLLSKTLWFNILALIVLVLDPFGFKDFVGDPHLAEYATMIVTLINLILRFVTSKPVDWGRLFPR